MEFKEILNPKTMVTHLDVNDKAEALSAMADILLKEGIINDKELYIKDVYEREAIGETGVGNHIAIPHGKSEAVVTPGVAVAVLEHEIEWESLDDTGAKIIVLFAVGTDQKAAEEHLRMLAMFSKCMGNDSVVARLLKADSVDEIIDAFLSDEEEETELSEEAELDLDEITIM